MTEAPPSLERGQMRSLRILIRAFTLVELLVVMGVMVVLLSLLGPAFASLTQSKGYTAAAYDIAALFDQARTYAMSKNTYVYVGLLEVPYGSDVKNGTTKFVENPTKAKGKLVAAAIASRDGTSGFDISNVATSWKANYLKGANFVQLGKVLSWDNVQLQSLPIVTISTSGMYRPNSHNSSYTAMDLGLSTSVSGTPIAIPLGSDLGSGRLNFSRVVVFSPQGIARVASDGEADAVDYVMEIPLIATHGEVVPTVTDGKTGNIIALQINPMTGSSKFYRP